MKKSPAQILDSVLLVLLVVAMCAQLNILELGINTLKSGQGFATKQLFIAVCDVLLLLGFGWFCLRTTAQRAWGKVWWPPVACWALILAMIIAAFHSPTIINALAAKLDEGGIKALIKAVLKEKEAKEAVAEIVQFSAYFLIAPLVFVNLMHDRRGGALISRRKLALHAFSGVVLLTVLIAFFEMLTGREAPAANSLFGTPNAYAAFLALALPLMIANILHIWTKPLPPLIATLATLVLAFLSTVSLWTVLAVLIGVTAAALLQKQAGRGIILGGIVVMTALIAWNTPGPPQILRHDFLSPYGNQDVLKAYGAESHGEAAPKPGDPPSVKKQYVEWYAALGWTSPRSVPGSETGERYKAFGTGVGPGNYQLNIGPFYDSLPNEEKMPPDSNNLFLVQAVSLGALGLGAIVWMFMHFAALALRTRKISGDWLPSGVMAALVSVLFVNLFHAMFVRGTALVLAFVFSLAAVAWLEARMQPSADEAV